MQEHSSPGENRQQSLAPQELEAKLIEELHTLRERLGNTTDLSVRDEIQNRIRAVEAECNKVTGA